MSGVAVASRIFIVPSINCAMKRDETTDDREEDEEDR